MSLLIFLLTMVLMVGVAIAGTNDALISNFGIVFYGLVVLAGLFTAISGALSTYKARKEYKHGYTTLQSFSKFGLYYRTLPQLDPRSGVEVRAAGVPKLPLPELTKRLSVCRAHHMRPDRLSRQAAAEAAVTAATLNEKNLELTKAKSHRTQLINRFGAAAGNMRADAQNYKFAALLTAGGSLPALILGVEGAAASRNLIWLLPAIVLSLIVTVMLTIGRRKTSHATRLAAAFLGLAVRDLPPWKIISAPEPASRSQASSKADRQ